MISIFGVWRSTREDDYTHGYQDMAANEEIEKTHQVTSLRTSFDSDICLKFKQLGMNGA